VRSSCDRGQHLPLLRFCDKGPGMLVHRQGRELATDRGNPRVIELGFKGEEEIGDGSIAAGSLAPSSLDVGRLCQRDRWALREMIDSLPMDEDPVCEECLMAFWVNCIAGPGPTRH
jgi:hypothetical protein